MSSKQKKDSLLMCVYRCDVIAVNLNYKHGFNVFNQNKWFGDISGFVILPSCFQPHSITVIKFGRHHLKCKEILKGIIRFKQANQS